MASFFHWFGCTAQHRSVGWGLLLAGVRTRVLQRIVDFDFEAGKLLIASALVQSETHRQHGHCWQYAGKKEIFGGGAGI